MRNVTFGLLIAMIVSVLPVRPALAVDAAHEAKAQAVIGKAIAYLKKEQATDGSWSKEMGPAVTGMILAGMTRHETLPAEDKAVAKGLAFLLSKQHEDGGIYDQILKNYNTSISLMALGPLRDSDPKIAEAVSKAQAFLKDLQWVEGKTDPDGKPIDEKHRWFGGQGYGKKGRPDLSNTATMIAGLRDSGLDCKDPAYIRAMQFITRMQGTEQNPEFSDKIEPGGGFIYAPSLTKEKIGELETKSETYIDAQGRSRLRTYGSMTYAGFMSYLYAQLDRDDPRVLDAVKWLREKYTLEENPGVGAQGYYYYLHMMARGLDAWTRGEPRGVTVDEPNTMFELADGKKIDWANELIDKLASLQKEDGSFVNEKASRWSEGNPHLATAYALLAIQHARK